MNCAIYVGNWSWVGWTYSGPIYLRKVSIAEMGCVWLYLYYFYYIYLIIYIIYLFIYLFYDKVWYISFCLIWLVYCYYTLSSYYIDLPFMAHSSSSYCIDIPFMVYSTDSSANCAVNTVAHHVAAVMIWGQPGSTTLLLSLKRRKTIQWCTSCFCHLLFICLRFMLGWSVLGNL